MWRTFLTIAALICLTAYARAEDSAANERKTLEGFGAANASCLEWTDGCAVCLRQNDGTAACSLPGIACQPAPVLCRTSVSSPAPADGQK